MTLKRRQHATNNRLKYTKIQIQNKWYRERNITVTQKPLYNTRLWVWLLKPYPFFVFTVLKHACNLTFTRAASGNIRSFVACGRIWSFFSCTPIFLLYPVKYKLEYASHVDNYVHDHHWFSVANIRNAFCSLFLGHPSFRYLTCELRNVTHKITGAWGGVVVKALRY